MGESKRRKQALGDAYGIPDINAQIQDAWETINTSIAMVKRQGQETVICQCCRNDRGFHPDAIQKMQQQLENWDCPLDIPMLIQMLPEGFRTSETKLFDGLVTVWCNCPDYKLWKELFEINIHQGRKTQEEL